MAWSGKTKFIWSCKDCDNQGAAPRAVAIHAANQHTLQTGHHVECVEVR